MGNELHALAITKELNGSTNKWFKLKEIENNDFLFMKGTPDAIQMGFSAALPIFKNESKLKGINVLENQNWETKSV